MFEGPPAETAVNVWADQVPPSDDWLSGRERAAQSRHRALRRTAEWRAGRWAAKCVVAARLGVDPWTVEILAGPRGEPEAWTEDHRLPVNVSISHRDGLAIAVATDDVIRPGCDLEVVEPRSAAFAEDWFTGDELTAVERAAPEERDELVTLIWSAKECVLKAMTAGLQVDTRRVRVTPGRDGFEAEVDGRQIHGWWKRDGRFVITAAALERTR